METAVLSLGAAYLWYKYYKTKKQIESEQEHYNKHNCVVTYSKIHGIIGWPGFKEEIYQLTCSNADDAFEPLVYFLKTTTSTLDVAVMALTSNILISILLSLLRKGVKLRLLVNYDHVMKWTIIKKLINCGAEVVIYVGTHNSGSIFHYKYAIKDFNTTFSSLYCGSLNWTNAGFINNYEHMVITTNAVVVNKFYSNYTKSINYVKELIENDVSIKVKIEEIMNNPKLKINTEDF